MGNFPAVILHISIYLLVCLRSMVFYAIRSLSSVRLSRYAMYVGYVAPLTARTRRFRFQFTYLPRGPAIFPYRRGIAGRLRGILRALCLFPNRLKRRSNYYPSDGEYLGRYACLGSGQSIGVITTRLRTNTWGR